MATPTDSDAGATIRFEPPACLACGSCCFSAAARYVRVTGDDWSRLGDAAEIWVEWSGNRAYLRQARGHCAALQVRPGSEKAAPEFWCRIYEQRPQVCRDLARGSPECHAEWTLKRGAAAHAAEVRDE